MAPEAGQAGVFIAMMKTEVRGKQVSNPDYDKGSHGDIFQVREINSASRIAQASAAGKGHGDHAAAGQP
jgi:hypothetical protein